MADRVPGLQTLFHAALELPPERRREFLEQRAGADVVEEILALLEADEAEDALVDGELGEVAEAVLAADPRHPEQIGPYRIESLLGRGGMGTVYQGVRDDVERRVAIKILPDATLSPERAARFRREQRLHAALTHPSIARLYDADTLADGTPYFVMELVDGRPITEYCVSRGLDLPARLALFRQACAAVREAHRHAIVHRDIKPSNILVTETDAGVGQATAPTEPTEPTEPTVKLLDFGIAKSLQGDDDELTRLGSGPMTPAYAAPEQHRGQRVGLFTDVYSLGVVLYELLAGSPPYDLAGRAPAEAEARVSAGDVDPPSRRAASNPTAVVASRRGWADLDLICRTAMAAEPEERYGSVDALIRDLRNFEDRLPLGARPPTTGEVLRKLVARNRLAFATGAAILLLVTAFVVALTLQAARLADERDRARQEAMSSERVADFLATLLQAASPERALGDDVRVVQLLDQAAERLDDELTEEPLVRARLLHVTGVAYSRLGTYDRASSLLMQAYEQRREILGDEHPDTLESRVRWARNEMDRGGLAQAEAVLREVLEMQQRVRGPETQETLDTADELAKTLVRSARPNEATPLFEKILESRKRILGEAHADTLATLGNLAAALKSSGRYGAAESLYREGLRLCQEHLPARHPNTLDMMTNLANLLIYSQRFEEAEPLLREALAGYEEVLGSRHDNTLRARTGLALALQNENRFVEAGEEFAAILAIQRETLGDGHFETIGSLYNLAGTYAERGDFVRAESLYREALELERAHLRPGHPYVGLTLLALGSLHRDTGDFELAMAELGESLGILEDFGGPNHPYVLAHMDEYAQLLRKMGRRQEADDVERRAAELRSPKPDAP